MEAANLPTFLKFANTNKLLPLQKNFGWPQNWGGLCSPPQPHPRTTTGQTHYLQKINMKLANGLQQNIRVYSLCLIVAFQKRKVYGSSGSTMYAVKIGKPPTLRVCVLFISRKSSLIELARLRDYEKVPFQVFSSFRCTYSQMRPNLAPQQHHVLLTNLFVCTDFEHYSQLVIVQCCDNQ